MSDKKKMGRPASANPRNKRLVIRLTDKEKKKLDKLAESEGVTITKLIVTKLQLDK